MRYIRPDTAPARGRLVILLRLFAFAFATILAVLGLGGTSARAAELTVSAAASLTQAMREIAAQFEAAQPGTQVRLNTGASGALLQQIANGAPVDVFASADLETMDRAQALGLTDAAARRLVASNRLVLVVPLGSRVVPQSLTELTGPAFRRIAVGLPGSVPAGRYAQEALQAAGLWQALESKVVGATSVRQALDYVARGEADAGFVYTTDAALMPERVRMAFVVPFTRPVVYPVAPVAASRQPALARRFVEFVAGPAGQAVLRRHGFGSP
jgi:molybdate transport system substrate-binding protein